MLAHEIIHHIKKPNIGGNVILKIDMANAYDRVSWSYICIVMSKKDFAEGFIDMVWRIMSNNWYSIIINGSRHGFFHSITCLIIIGAEVLSRFATSVASFSSVSWFLHGEKGSTN